MVTEKELEEKEIKINKATLAKARDFKKRKGAGGEPEKPPCHKKLTPELKNKIVEFL